MKQSELYKIRKLCSTYYSFDTWAHALRVEKYVRDDARYALLSPDEQLIVSAVALLHDIREDTKCTEWQIAKCIQNPLDVIVVIRTLRIVSRKIGEKYFTYIRRLISSRSLYAIMVKQADMKDHLSESATLTASLEKRYRKAAKILLTSDNI